MTSLIDKDQIQACATAIMAAVIEDEPKHIIPALIVCIQTVVSLSAQNHEHGRQVIEMVKTKLDNYASPEQATLDLIMQNMNQQEVH